MTAEESTQAVGTYQPKDLGGTNSLSRQFVEIEELLPRCLCGLLTVDN